MALMCIKNVNVWPSRRPTISINSGFWHGIRERILDFGAGKGELISLLAHMDGMELHGVDIMKRPENIPACVNWYQWDLNDALVRAQPKRVLRHPLRCANVLECRLRAGSSW